MTVNLTQVRTGNQKTVQMPANVLLHVHKSVTGKGISRAQEMEWEPLTEVVPYCLT